MLKNDQMQGPPEPFTCGSGRHSFVGNGFRPFPTGTLQQAGPMLDTGKDKGWCCDE